MAKTKLSGNVNSNKESDLSFSAEECKLLVGCMDAAVKQAQDSMAASFQLFPVREKLEKHMKELGAEDGNTDPTD
jgi:hypothetical protein